MKHDLDNLDLRPAFRDEPDKCHQALMNAVHSIKEEEQDLKRVNFRPLLIAAIVIVSMLSMAYAASEIFGLNEYFQKFDVFLTQEQQEALKPDKETAWQVGPMTFTLQERVADPYYAYISTKVDMTDASHVLMCMDPEERLSDTKRTALNLEMVERDYGHGAVITQPTYLEAAQQTGLPLYSIRAIIEMPEGQGDGMESILHTSTASVYINSQTLQKMEGKTEFPTTLFLRVSQIDPASGEEVEKWSTRESYTIPMIKLLATGHYTAETPLVTDGMPLTHLDTELYETGMYVHRSYQMTGDTPPDKNTSLWYIPDETPLSTVNGEVFMQGISLSGAYDWNDWPTLSFTEMINVTELPEIIQVGGVNYKLQPK